MSDDKPKFSFSNAAANCDEHIDRSIRGFNHLRDDVVTKYTSLTDSINAFAGPNLL